MTLDLSEPQKIFKNFKSPNGDGNSDAFLSDEPTPPTVDTAAIENAIRDLLVAIGEDPNRDGLVNTPERVARFWREFIEYNPGTIDTTFESDSNGQVVTVSNMRVWSLCEHHLLPFWCDVTIAYIAGDRIPGLSKFARAAHLVAHKLQIQEGMTRELADLLETMTGSNDVAVNVRGEHTCMIMRGIRTSGKMMTRNLRGRFDRDALLRSEFLNHCHD